ncbi:restriction endonuclease [Alterisphingorhabdus coralli]|uniref:Restriction endonuclease n=1 Tax=Alterisphingorhabdus coralli TaxID=3071408 RepID=A0AA97F6U5_9SPHN|nr:restriction endonuclease [Parasphingorhabdus sp. SCSIO 66989]WOE75016.1 restriction endonuclease [Parasphingorhabdus sp. SCSIO 66989]
MARRFIVDADSLPSLPGMMLVTIEALKELGGSASIHELDEKVIEIEGVTEAEQTHPMSGNDNRARINYYLAWSRTYLKRGGAIINSARGVWAVTESGLAISSLEQTQEIYEQVSLEERERSKEKRNIAKSNQSQSDYEQSEADHRQDGWKTDLLGVLTNISPDAFERLAQRLLREAGFTKVEVRGKSGDGGIDGVGVLRVNLVSFQVYFQCKRWKGSVGSKEIRDFRGALQGRADKGLFITTGYFTGQASDEATRDGAIAIDLIDGERLCELLKENKLGVETKMVEHIFIDPEWFQEL